LADKQHLEAMLTALDASPRALERPMCRGWIGDWQISGSDGHIMTDGREFVFYISTESPRRWTGIKKRLGFCRLTQDGDDEGCLYLERLPKADEAVLIREAIGIRKRRHLTPEALVALERDFRDAHAVAEAVERRSTRCVPIKADEQLGTMMLLMGKHSRTESERWGFATAR
jgi:hypothetical protein